MKKTILIGLIVLMTSCTSKYKYLIKDHKGQYYLCNFYNKTGDDCILFNDKPVDPKKMPRGYLSPKVYMK